MLREIEMSPAMESVCFKMKSPEMHQTVRKLFGAEDKYQERLKKGNDTHGKEG